MQQYPGVCGDVAVQVIFLEFPLLEAGQTSTW